MPIQEFDFASGKTLDPKRHQAIVGTADGEELGDLKEALRQKHYQYLGRENDLRAVLERVKKAKVGILFLDVALAGDNIKTVMASLKKAYPDVNVVLICESITKDFLGEMMRQGSKGFLVKPITTDATTKILSALK